MGSQRPIVIDDTDSRIKYGQGWFQDNGSQDSFGNFGPTYEHTLHGTTTNNQLSFSFKGTWVRIMGTTNLAKLDNTHYDPSWECFVDNVSIGSTQPFPYRENNWIMCTSGTLSDGPHEITLKVTITNGNTFWLDAIYFLPSPSDVYDTEVLLVDNLDPGIGWGAGWTALGGGANITTQHGSTAGFNFVGTGLSWVGYIPTEWPHGASSGSFSIDGGDPTSFSLVGLPADATTTVYNQIFFSTPQLSPGPHSLLVTYNGDTQHTPLTLDYIYLTNKTILASTGSSAPLPTPNSLPSNTQSSNSQSSDTQSSVINIYSSLPSPSGSSPSRSGSASPTPGTLDPATTTTTATSGSKALVGAIAGGVLGGLAILILIAILIVYLKRRSRKREYTNTVPAAEPGVSPFMSTYGSNNDLTTPFIPIPSSSNTSPATHQSQPSQSGTESLMAVGYGYNWGADAVAGGVVAAAVAPVQPLRKAQEDQAEQGHVDRNLIRHEDSGIRIPPGGHRVTDEIPPMYTVR